MNSRVQFDAEIKALEARFQSMCQATGDMLQMAVAALETGNPALINAVIERDDEVDADNVWLETECMRLVIQQQPVAHDLRVIGMIFKAITDVERIADHAVDIAKIAVYTGSINEFVLITELRNLGAEVQKMFQFSKDAFASYDTQLAATIIEQDNVVDDLFHTLRDRLMRLMQDDREHTVLASNLIFAVQFLERIGDRCVNMAERIHLIEWGLPPDRPHANPV